MTNPQIFHLCCATVVWDLMHLSCGVLDEFLSVYSFRLIAVAEQMCTVLLKQDDLNLGILHIKLGSLSNVSFNCVDCFNVVLLDIA